MKHFESLRFKLNILKTLRFGKLFTRSQLHREYIMGTDNDQANLIGWKRKMSLTLTSTHTKI